MSPRGLSKIRQLADESAARQAAYEAGGGGQRPLILKNGESIKARFLEQGEDVWYVFTHQLPAMPGQKFGDTVACLDQDDAGAACPGCQRGLPRSARVAINLIHYGAPEFERDKDKKLVKNSMGNLKVVGRKDAVVTWNASQAVGGRLEYLDSKHGGLTGHIFTITRQGTGKQTTYMIDLEERDVAPTPEDRKLYEVKPDPRRIIKQMGYGDMERCYSGGAGRPEAGQGDGAAPSSMENNAFANAAAGAIKHGAFYDNPTTL